MKGTARKNISQEGGFFSFIWPLMTVRTSLAKSILMPLGLMSAATALIISNEEMEDVMKIVESHKESALLKVLVKQLELKQKK